MDKTVSVRFFVELVTMMSSMVENIMPDMLLHLDEGTLENLRSKSEEACTSLQVFSKLCSIISKRNLTCSSLSIAVDAVDQCPEEESETVDAQLNDVQQSEQSSSVDDHRSVVSNFSEVTARNDSVWKTLINDARKWYALHSSEPIPQIYYCGVCDKLAIAKHVWNSHLNGKNHKRLSEEVVPLKFACETCGLQVFGEDDFINIVVASKEHKAFDALVCDSSAASDSISKNSVTDSPKGEADAKAHDLVVPSKAKVDKVIFQFTEIHPDFVRITRTIAEYIENHDEYAIGYCRPCEAICKSKQLWNVHKHSSKHVAKMSSKFYKNVLCRCLQCEFVITANVKMATIYMKYHIEHCHHQSTHGIKIDEYMEIKQLLSVNKTEPESKASSFKGSSRAIDKSTASSSLAGSSAALDDDGGSASDPIHRDDVSSTAIDRDGVSLSPALQKEPLLDGNSESSGSLRRSSSNPYSLKSSMFGETGSDRAELQRDQPPAVDSVPSRSVGKTSSNPYAQKPSSTKVSDLDEPPAPDT